MKNVAVLTEDGAFALFFRPHPRGFDSSRLPTPGNLPSKAKKMLMPGGQPGGGGGGLGAGGIDWCIIISVTPARLTWNKLARQDYKTTSFLCVFLNKEITSFNKNIVQLIFQFGSVNSRNLSPLTELITKTVEGTKLTPVRRKIGAKPYEITEPRTSELVNLVFSRKTGIQSANIRFSLINWWS